ncbi:MAG: PD-(D/E)XK nuclease domain-containing protein, partial [Bacteroidota bacterium]
TNSFWACPRPYSLGWRKEWYNGYRFTEDEIYVYNPFSTLNYMDEGKPKNYWYATSTPTFLIHEIQKRPAIAASLAPISASENQLTDARTIEDIELSTLMFQTGYLTIQHWEYDTILKTTIYHLNFPNEEVHQAFYQSLARELGKTAPQVIAQLAIQLQQELTTLDLASAVKTINIQFAKIPYNAFKDAKEGFYQAMLLLCLELSGLRTYGEVHTNLGRIDLVVQQPQHTFIFELKVDQPAAVALDQIHTKNYQERYLKDGKEIVAVAASFSTQTRNISEWKAGLYTAEGALVRELA